MGAKQLTLFGEEVGLKELKRCKAEVFEDYDGFLDKFETKKTTDDCYTPSAVYDAVLDFVRGFANLDNVPIVRPFYPGGDYENYIYPEGCVVIDNPPFSLLSKICRFYCAHSLPFFLFGPALTLFTAPDCDLTYIIADAQIVYENGAVVATGFVTNMIPDLRIWCAPELKYAIEKAQEEPSKKKKGFVYPNHIVTAATLGKIPAHGVDFKIRKCECEYIKSADSAEREGRSLFGGGFLLSNEAAAERAAAERAAAERAAAERAAASKILLSPRELRMVAELDSNSQNCPRLNQTFLNQ